MDEIRQKIEDFQKQLLPSQSLLKETLLSCPAILPAVGLIIGLVLQYYFNSSLLTPFIILIFCVISFLLLRFYKKFSINLISIVIVLCFACLGSIRLTAYNTPASNDIRNIPIKDFTFAHIKAQIISEPVIVKEGDWLFWKFSQSLPYTTFYAKVTNIKTNQGSSRCVLPRLDAESRRAAAAGWKKADGKIKFYISQEADNLNIGDVFQTFCQLQKFSSPDNPGQFDAARYMNSNSVYFSASIKSINALTVLNSEKPKSSFNIKAKLRSLAIAALVDDAEPEGNIRLIEAVVLGSRTKIDKQLYNDFIKTGLVHLICLSGLNVGIFAGVAWWVSKKAGLLHRGRAIACIIATIIFLLIVPAQSSTLRAGMMFIIFCLAYLFDRRANLLNSIALSAIFLLLIKPMDFLNPGFQLSFAATTGIVLFYPSFFDFLLLPFQPLEKTYFYKMLKIPLAIFSTGCAAWLAVTPIIIWHFYQVQLLTPIWTVPASFPMTIIIVLGSFKILLAPLLPTLAYGLGFIIDFSANVLVYLVTSFAKISSSHIIIGKVSICIVLLFYLIIFLWKFLPSHNKPILNYIYPSLMLFLFIIAFSLKYRNSDDLRLTVLSVGHGQAAVVQLPGGQNIIVDAGSMSRNDIGTRIVNPFLNYIAAGKIDSVFISHDDIDHYNGIPEIFNNHNIKNVYTTCQFIRNAETSTADAMLTEFINSKNITLRVAPEKISLGKTTITRLWPKSAAKDESDNESSLVLLIEYAGRKILFCSDITADAQKQLMKLYPAFDIDILITPHHGSVRTTDPDFPGYFKPEYLITSCSSARLSSISPGIKEYLQSYLTCKDGAITASINQQGRIEIKTYIP